MDKFSASVVICLAALAVGCYGQGTATCNAPGVIKCDTGCANVVVCMGDTAGGYMEESVEICDAAATTPTACSASLRKCSSETNSCDPDLQIPFECTHTGQFPHPTDCTKYYFCVDNAGTLVPIPTDCDPGFAYNSTRNICNLPLNHRTCIEGPVPVCVDIGESGPTIENPSIFYICKRKSYELYPVLYICNLGGAFNNTAKECDPPLIRGLVLEDLN